MSNYIIQHLKPIATAAHNKLEQFKYRFNIISQAELIDLNNDDYVRNLIKSEDNFKFINERPDDFIILKSVLATSLPYINGNGDAFKKEDLEEVVKNGQLSYTQPAIIDWDHDFSPRGNTIHAELIDAEVEVDGIGLQPVKQIVVYSVFYAWLFPFEAEKIREWAEKGILAFSMACGAEDVEYINGTVRVLIKPQFFANSIITPEKTPADKNAKLKSIASKTNRSEDMNIKELENKIKELEAVIAEKDKKIAELQANKLSEEFDSLKAQYDELQKQLDSLKADKEKALAEKDNEINALNAALEQAKNEFAELKAKFDELKEKYVAAKRDELENINKERKEKLAEYITSDETLEKWFEMYKAEMDEDGNLKLDNGFDEFIAVLAETAKANLGGDVDKSDKVDKSQAGFVPPANPKEDKVISSWA